VQRFSTKPGKEAEPGEEPPEEALSMKSWLEFLRLKILAQEHGLKVRNRRVRV
jgi:hypothetical protein